MKTFNFKKWLEENTEDHYPYYNGGWVKRVRGLDKTKQNGYSILGEFVEKEGDFLYKDGLYLLCDKQGSRGHQEWNYYLIKLEDQTPSLIFKILNGKRDWALKFWEPIEKELGNKKSDEEKIRERLQQLIKEFGKDKVKEILKEVGL